MRALVPALALALALSPIAAAQEDGGYDDASLPDAATVDATVGCGEVTILGACTETGVAWCSGDQVYDYDCPAGTSCTLMDCADGAHCMEVTGQSACEGDGVCRWVSDGCYPRCYGYECVSPPGGECNIFFDLDGDGYPDFQPCENAAGYGCLDGTCAISSSCAADAPPSCAGNSLQICVYGTLSSYNCDFDGSQPYVCGTTSTGDSDCLGTEGAQCDPSQGWECATGYTCSGGICTSGTGHDAGVGQDLSRPTDAARRDNASSADRASGYDSNVTCNCAAGYTCTAAGTCVPASGQDGGNTSPPTSHQASCFGCAQQGTAAAGSFVFLLALLLWRRRV